MSRAPWSEAEEAILRAHYPTGGLPACHPLLPHRSKQAIYMRVNLLGIRTVSKAKIRQSVLSADQQAEVYRLSAEGWPALRIARHLGHAESSINNLLVIERGRRMGFTPLPRDQYGHLTAESIDKIRLMLRKGMKGVEIQERAGVSAACVAEQRRRYQRDLKARKKAPLPPPGGGQVYTGHRFTRQQLREIEALFLQGFGTKSIERQTGIGHTTIIRERRRLVARLARKGQCLPGCDITGKRRRIADATNMVPQASIDRLRQLLLTRLPVAAAARIAGIGKSKAYEVRDQLRDELAARGEALPPPIRTGCRAAAAPASLALPGMPTDRAGMFRFRQLLRIHGTEQEALKALQDEQTAEKLAAEARRRAEALRPKTFEEQLERVRRGEATISRKLTIPTRALPDMTLGGVATGQLA